MGTSASDHEVRALQQRAEQAIRGARPREQVVRLLEQLVALAPAHDVAARFAHRNLAELRLEESPWRAALHLRHVLAHDGDDDIALALMGLCQALLSNFRAAIAAFRRAVALAPSNPWYNHNLGHLLDVALGASRDALPYLRRAHRLEPGQDEVAASLAHCLGRVGARDEALALARTLAARNPREAERRALVTWLEQGARAAGDTTVPGLLAPATSPVARAASKPPPSPSALARASAPPGARHGSAGPTSDAGGDEVGRLLAQRMSRSGCGTDAVDRAWRLWRDYHARVGAVQVRPDVAAAAAEYALCRVDGVGDTQREVAERYGVSPSALQTRYAAMRTALGLHPKDPRYVVDATAPARRSDDERS